MTAGILAPGEVAVPPTLDRSKGSFGASDFGSPSGGSESDIDPGFTAARAHGLLLGLAFMVFFPTGAVLLKSGFTKAFRAHVALQLMASLSAFGGVALIAWPIVKNNAVS